MKKKKSTIFVILSLFVLMVACTKEETTAEETTSLPSSSIPILTTAPITSITFSTALNGGLITSDGGSTVTSRGVCWSIATNPTIALSTKTIDGAGIGSFTSVLAELKENTTYYIKAYATNSIGTAYGTQLSFITTTAMPGCGNITDIDANIYPSVTIGSQCWMRENLKTSKYRNGDVIPQVQDPSKWANLTTGAWCYYQNGDGTLNSVNGKLYNWYAVNDSRGLAPTGWHIPVVHEFDVLIASLGGAMSATKMKATTGWNNDGATNSSGFTALSAGSRGYTGPFLGVNMRTHWWTTTLQPKGVNNKDKAWFMFLMSNDSECHQYYEDINSGFSVRCVRD
jgi:uncharacterized protein (TIGR02145 family)